MEVFPWARWGGNDNLPLFTLNQTFVPSELMLKEVQPQASLLLHITFLAFWFTMGKASSLAPLAFSE